MVYGILRVVSLEAHTVQPLAANTCRMVPHAWKVRDPNIGLIFN